MDQRGASLDSVESGAVSRRSSSSSGHHRQQQPQQPITTVRLQPSTNPSHQHQHNQHHSYQSTTNVQQPVQPHQPVVRSLSREQLQQQPQQPQQPQQNFRQPEQPTQPTQPSSSYFQNHHHEAHQPQQPEQPMQPTPSQRNHQRGDRQHQQPSVEPPSPPSPDSARRERTSESTSFQPAVISGSTTGGFSQQPQQSSSLIMNLQPLRSSSLNSNSNNHNNIQRQQQQRSSSANSNPSSYFNTTASNARNAHDQQETIAHNENKKSESRSPTPVAGVEQQRQVQEQQQVPKPEEEKPQEQETKQQQQQTSRFVPHEDLSSISPSKARNNVDSNNEERERLEQKHQDEIHKLKLQLSEAKTALNQSNETSEAMEKRLRAALEAEQDAQKQNTKLRQQLDDLSVRAKTKDGDFASWEDMKNTLFVNNIKGRFEITVHFFESLLDLVLYDKKLAKDETSLYQKMQERLEQLLNESEQLREDMQTAAAQSDDAHIKNLEMAHNTIEELQREVSSLKRTGSSINNTSNINNNNMMRDQTTSESNNNYYSRGVTPSPHFVGISNNNSSNNNNNNSQQNNINQQNNNNNNNLRGASSTYLRSVTAPLDPEATSRRLQEELSDALQAKESLTQTNRGLRKKITELEDEMKKLYTDSKRVHEMMRQDVIKSKTKAMRETNDEIAKARVENQQLNSGLISRVQNLEQTLDERTQALVMAQQQVNHLTDLLEDATKAGGIPLLRTKNPKSSIYPKFTLGGNSSSSAIVAAAKSVNQITPAWAEEHVYGNSTKKKVAISGSGLTTSFLNTLSASSPSSQNQGWTAGSLATATANKNRNNNNNNNSQFLTSPRVTTTPNNKSSSTPNKPDWNNSKKVAMPFVTSSQFSTPPPKEDQPYHRGPNHQLFTDPASFVSEDETTTPNYHGYTAGMLPRQFFPPGSSSGNNNNNSYYNHQQAQQEGNYDEEFDGGYDEQEEDSYENRNNYRREEY